MTKIIISAVLAVVLGVAIWGGYQFPKTGFGALPTGTTNQVGKVATVAMAPTSNTSTTSAILNDSGTDRIVTDAFVSCTGLTNMFGITAAGLATYKWGAGTSTTATISSPVIDGPLALLNVTVATSSVDGFTATSTYTVPFSRRWNSGTYLVFETNGTSSTAACTPGVRYIAV